MRLFCGGSKGLVLYEDDELSTLSTEPVLCVARQSASRLLFGGEAGRILVLDNNNGGPRVAAKDVGDAVHGLVVTPKGTVFAGTIPAGVWRSKDAGETWEDAAEFATVPGHENWSAPWGVPLVSAMSTHPKDAKTLYCGVEAGGLYRSRDGGKTWFDLELPCSDVHSVQVCPARPERLYVTTGGGSFCSDDEGFGWREMGPTLKHAYTMGLAAHPGEPDRVIISAAAGPPSAWKDGSGCDVYLSTDAGRRFRTVASGLGACVQRKALMVNAKVPSEVVFGTSSGELYYSNDGGESFDMMADQLGDLKAIIFA